MCNHSATNNGNRRLHHWQRLGPKQEELQDKKKPETKQDGDQSCDLLNNLKLTCLIAQKKRTKTGPALVVWVNVTWTV